MPLNGTAQNVEHSWHTVYCGICANYATNACVTMVDSELWQIKIETVLLVFIAR